MKTRYIIMLLGLILGFIPMQANNDIWEHDPYAYQYDMSVYAAIKINEEIASPTRYSLGAFHGEECRGIAVVQEKNSSYYYYLRIRSNNQNGENITFKIYDNQTGIEMGGSWLQTTMTFNANDRKGYPSSPFIIEFKQPTHHNVTILPCLNGHISGEGGIIESGKEITLTAIPDEGYEFTTWTNGETRNPYTFQVTEDVEIGAKFHPKRFKISYIIDGETVATDSVAYMAEIIPPSAPTKEGYTFNGWDDVPQNMPAKDITITGNYTVNVYALRYFVDDAEYFTDSIPYGSPITLIDAPRKEGYVFSGWSEVPKTMPAKDIRVDGTFKQTDLITSPSIATNTLVDVYSTDGKIIKRNIRYKEVVQKLKSGIYIINGKCVHIKK